MERKRKLPARAAARVEHVAKKRTSTPPERSLTPAPAPPVEPVVEEPQLPKSIQSGNPLPTVETAQSEGLPNKDYQSIQESGVLAESISRSRQRWVTEGIFEKYWTKPVKRKGVVKEEPNNPPKDSMTKVGVVTITVEPHVFEATMYAIKDQKPPGPSASTPRPVMQYGPPNGVMPPPPKPASTPSTPTVSASATARPSPSPTPAQLPPAQTPSVPQAALPTSELQHPPPPPPPQTPSHPVVTAPSAQLPNTKPPLASPRGLESVLAPPTGPPAPPPIAAPSPTSQRHPSLTGPSPLQSPSQPSSSLSNPVNQTPSATLAKPLHAPSPTTAATTGLAAPATKTPASSSAPGAKPATASTAPGADPIIVTLAEKASEDPHLRDLMKRVAIGEATPAELSHFQKIIDQITIEYKRKGGQQGPSADRLIVDGKTVKHIADEVRTILDIVLASNPKQRSVDLRAPPNSDPLFILLVKKALDEPSIRDLVRRVAENKTKFADATDLKAILDKLKDQVGKQLLIQTHASPVAMSPSLSNTSHANGVPNGPGARKPSISSSAPSGNSAASQQALRSKGPPPIVKPDISAIVLEFSGGTGDRYLFPKFSIVEYQHGASQMIASFLIVRRGSKLEYGGDPSMDYYQPVTIHISSPSPKHLENLTRVVAPQDEVRRYMDDIMDSMTRAEYILLAMRLPRADRDEQVEERADTPKQNPPSQGQLQHPNVLWTAKSTSSGAPHQKAIGKPLGEEEYRNFIATVS